MDQGNGEKREIMRKTLGNLALGCAGSAIFSLSAAQGLTLDANGVPFPLQLCNEKPFGIEVRRSLSYQALIQDVKADKNIPKWAIDGIALDKGCTLSDIVLTNMTWWIAYYRHSVPVFENARHREHFVLMYSPDFRYWTGMLEVLDFSEEGWKLTGRHWFNDAPAWRQLLMSQTIDPAIYEMPFSGP